MKLHLLIGSVLAALLGCGPVAPMNAPPPIEPAPAATPTTSDNSVERDNTAVNKRDQETSSKTPIDQDENKRDVQITADIRKLVVSDDAMSVNGKNVKIITSQGKVTLRGPVASEAEKQKIEQFAKDVVGEDNFVSQIEISP